jgi:hypothetical protein
LTGRRPSRGSRSIRVTATNLSSCLQAHLGLPIRPSWP